MKKLVLVLLVSCVVLVGALPACADQPDTEVWEYDFTIPGIDCAYWPGYDFQIYEHLTGVDTTRYYFDKDGVVVRTSLQTKGTDILFNGTKPENFVQASYDGNWHNELGPENTWTSTFSGLWFKIEPVEGSQPIHISGQLVSEQIDDIWYPVKLVGLQHWDGEALCEALAE